MKKLLILLLAIFLSAGSLSAQSVDIKKLLQQAKQGDAKAQSTLGGIAVLTEDSVGAVKWFRLAADQGLASAQFHLGLMYDNGQGVPQEDYVQAAKWYRLAANKGDASAQYYLAFKYKKGQGVSQSYEQAANWFRLAADQGYASAQFSLGAAYLFGQGVSEDEIQALVWMIRAADQGDVNALKSREFIELTMTPQQIAQVNWKPKKQ